MPQRDPDSIRAALADAVARARPIRAGSPADYIPELAKVDPERVCASVTLVDGTTVSAGDTELPQFTLQSSAKLVVLAGLLEERGAEEVFRTVGAEPSGGTFASIARLETHGPKPANPLVNSGAIALCGRLPGSVAQRQQWVSDWAARLYARRLPVDEAVLRSERTSAARNRAIAHYLQFAGILGADVEETLLVYFGLCSLRGTTQDASQLPALLANGGVRPGTSERVLSPQTVAVVVSLMATCGMYNESGGYLVATGMPAKSGVSGVIVAVAPGVGGVAVYSPRLNEKGGSVRGHAILEDLARSLGWHFALCSC